MKASDLKPLAGKLLAEVITGDYETESGILVVNSMKKKKPERAKILAVGGPFFDWPVYTPKGSHKLDLKNKPMYKKGPLRQYAANPGETVWFKNGTGQKLTIERKLHIMFKNDDLVAVEHVTHEGEYRRLKAARNIVLVFPKYDGKVEGSSLIVLHERDKKYIGNMEAEVISLGPEYRGELKVGMNVYWRRHEGTKIEYDNKEYLALMPRWVEGILS